MKKMLLAAALVVSAGAWAQDGKAVRTFDDLVGSWRNKNGAGFDIVDSNTVYIVRRDQRRQATAQIANIGKNPVSFNLTVRDSSRQVTLKGLLMLVGDNSLQWQVFDTDTKPASYTASRGDLLYLRRIQTLVN